MEPFRATREEILAALGGEDAESLRREEALRGALEKKTEELLNLAPEHWPKLHFNWSVAPESWHYSFDGVTPTELAQNYPSGLCLGWVDLRTFDSRLCFFNRRRDTNELWNCGSKYKLAFTLAYLSCGHPISPVVAAVALDGQLCLHGGNHRYTAAKFSGETTFPFICRRDDYETLSNFFPVAWSKNDA